MNNYINQERIINANIFKALFINNTNALAKLISDITKIPYSKLKNNILIITNEITIINKKEKINNYDYIVKLNNESIKRPKLNTKKYKGLKNNNLSYSFNLYSNSTKISSNNNENFLIIQINLNTFSDKSTEYMDVFELRNKNGKKYIDNFKIYTLDIVKCHKLYHNNQKINNTIKWGAFLYSKIKDKNITDILSNILEKIDFDELKSRLENINMEIK